MKVTRRMTSNPVTVSPKTSHREAVEIMREKGIRRLPVVEKGKLIGIVSETDLLSNAPSQATSLSIYEIYTLLDKLTVDQIMSSPVFAIDEDCDLAAAARFMVDHKIGCLPVVSGEKIVGIITETDIYKAFVEVLGGGEPGLRVDLEVEDRKGVLAQITKAVAEAGGNFLALTVFEGADVEHAEISFKEQGADEAALREKLEAIGNTTILRIRKGGTDQLIKLGG